MIEFVIYDDQKEYCDMILDAIRQATGDLFEQCEVKKFNSFNKDFEKVIENDSYAKIYIMDIEVPKSLSGIDVARIVRRKDWDSIIILVTSHVELSYEALKAQIMLLDFICKQSNCVFNLTQTLKKAIHKINNNKTLNFDINGMSYRVYTDDILWIQKDSIERKCLIKTSYNVVSINCNLRELADSLDERFFQTHRSCIINIEKIKDINWKKNIIYFVNGESIDYLSRDRKKSLRERV